MAKYGTDFTEYTAGADLTLEDWSIIWEGNGLTWTAEDSVGSEDGGRVGQLDLVGTNSGRHAVGWDVPGLLDEGSIFARFRITDQRSFHDVHQAIASNQLLENGENSLMVGLSTSNNSESVSLQRYNEGTFTSAFLGPSTFTFTLGDWINILYDFRSSSFSVKVWLGDRNDETGAVEITGTKPTAKTGSVGINMFNYDTTYEVDFFGVDDTGGDPPRSMSDLGPTLTNATASNDGADGYTGSVDTDTGTGTLYHVVTQSSTAPTPTQVKNAQNHNGDPADADGSQAISSTGTKSVGQTGVLTVDTQYWIHYVQTDASSNDSNVATSGSFTTGEALTITGNFDGGNLNSSTTAITNASNTEPDVSLVARLTDTDGSGDRFKIIFFRLDKSLDKRPSFEIDLTNYASEPTAFRPWYTYDDPSQDGVSWTRWDSAPTNVSGSTYSFQLSTAFTQDTVYIASHPGYPVGLDLSFIQAMKSAHPDRVHLLPSITDEANWSGGDVSSQTDEQGRTIPVQPMRGFGVWDGKTYPGNGLPKATVVLTSGVHAGEVLGDWTCEKSVRFLLSGDPVAERLLQNFQFFVYPCVNPMGRWGGHDRGQWDPANLSKDPNRDWQDDTLESTQLIKSMMQKDIVGRTVVLWIDYHSWAGTGTGRGTEPTFYLYQSQAQTTFVNTWQSAVAAYGDYSGQEFTTADSIGNYALQSHGDRHAYTSEAKEYESPAALDDWAIAGEHWMKALDDINEGADSAQTAFEGKYLALDFTGSGVGTAELFDMMAASCPTCESEKIEKGIGVDAAGLWRADMNAVTSADVFVVVSDDQYVTPENTRSHARRYTPSDTNG